MVFLIPDLVRTAHQALLVVRTISVSDISQECFVTLEKSCEVCTSSALCDCGNYAKIKLQC